MSYPQIVVICVIHEFFKVLKSYAASDADHVVSFEEITSMRHQMSLKNFVTIARESTKRAIVFLVRIDEFFNIIAVNEAVQVVGLPRLKLQLTHLAAEIVVGDENVIVQLFFSLESFFTVLALQREHNFNMVALLVHVTRVESLVKPVAVFAFVIVGCFHDWSMMWSNRGF